MFNLTSRLQAATNQLLTSSIIVSGIIVVLTISRLYLDNAWSIDSTSLWVTKPTTTVKYSFSAGSVDRKPKENSKIAFDLDADLTPLFNWNTKQVFVYLTAEYPGKSEGSSNKVTYWDSIITSKDDAKITLKNQKSKYSVWDVEKSFRSRDAVVKLEWNIQPHIGPLIFGETGASSNFTFAAVKEKKKSNSA